MYSYGDVMTCEIAWAEDIPAVLCLAVFVTVTGVQSWSAISTNLIHVSFTAADLTSLFTRSCDDKRSDSSLESSFDSFYLG